MRPRRLVGRRGPRRPGGARHRCRHGPSEWPGRRIPGLTMRVHLRTHALCVASLALGSLAFLACAGATTQGPSDDASIPEDAAGGASSSGVSSSGSSGASSGTGSGGSSGTSNGSSSGGNASSSGASGGGGSSGATGCQTAADCHGALPQICQVCSNGSNGCAHFECTGGVCTIAYCAATASDAGPATDGGACTSDTDCTTGLKCCYPCGVQGCTNKCITPLAGNTCPHYP
jgi:hypothetical protein